MKTDLQTASTLNRNIRRFFFSALHQTMMHPRQLLPAGRMLLAQLRAGQRRLRLHKEGVQVPPFMIASVTASCNLRCRGCYAMKFHGQDGDSMDTETLQGVFEQARELGISVVIVAGGEPFLRNDLLALTRRYPSITFAVFTNGLLIDDALAAELAKQRHVIPVVSVEGSCEQTDARRGEGVYARLQQTFSRLRSRGLFWGVSTTVTKENLQTGASPDSVEALLRKGCGLFFFIEYVPVQDSSGATPLDEEDRQTLLTRVHALDRRYPGLFVSFPGDEEEFGGCLSSGKGFLHVNHHGGVEPCPFAPFSDVSLTGKTLREALESPFMTALRNRPDLLTETTGGCALWVRREEVAKLHASCAAE
jgi:MoaA/NifB/PqqE/SkfB family radical SAM enzyme